MGPRRSKNGSVEAVGTLVASGDTAELGAVLVIVSLSFNNIRDTSSRLTRMRTRTTYPWYNEETPFIRPRAEHTRQAALSQT
ncbi:MAG: hypothetical protein OHK0022_24560 [Roseiflexaceae bacterium]